MTSSRRAVVAQARESINKGSISFALAARIFDPAVRDRVFMLYSWCRACDDLTDDQDHGFSAQTSSVNCTARALTDRALNTIREVSAPFNALRTLVQEVPLDPQDIDDHLRGFDLDEWGWSPDDETDLIGYCHHVAGVVGSMMARLMGVKPEDADTLARARHLGISFQLNNIARDIVDDAKIGRVYLPRTWLDEIGLSDRDRLDAQADHSKLAPLAARLIIMARAFDASARVGAARLPLRSRIAILAAANIYGAIGETVVERGVHAWNTRAGTSAIKKIQLLSLALPQALRHSKSFSACPLFDDNLWRARLDVLIQRHA